MRDVSFYQDHLDRVSRSFAFCIRELAQPMRGWVSLSYVLCRLLDTVEDAPWPDPGQRQASYRQFDHFVWGEFDRAEVDAWAQTFPTAIVPGERQLLDDAWILFEDLRALPLDVRDVIRDVVGTMSAGMQHYAEQQSNDGDLRLLNIKEVNRYCYFVAGIVGQLLTRLFLLHRPDFQPQRSLLKDAFHFGLFLQKVNILKDQYADELEGRFLVPNRDEVVRSLVENAMGSLEYLTALPVDERGYRTFCAWSLFLGVASLPVICAATGTADPVKIDHGALATLLARTSAIVEDNAALRRSMEAYLDQLPHRRPPPAPVEDWFCTLSGDALRTSELSELHVL